jgi:hypothetical protein
LEHSRPLTQPVSARRDRIVTAIWVATSVVAVAYAAIGIFVGLAHQDLAPRPALVACDYRVELIRDRLISLHERLPPPGEGPADFSNLLRETRAICAGSDPAVLRKLARIEVLYREFDERFDRQADARQELLAL